MNRPILRQSRPLKLLRHALLPPGRRLWDQQLHQALGSQLLGSKPHVDVYYDPSAWNALTVAQGVLAGCEQDYEWLASLFGVDAHFTITVTGGMGAARTFTDLSVTSNAGSDAALGYAAYLEVSYLAGEQSLSSCWQGASGEALTRVLACDLHPSVLSGLATGAQWLDSPQRTDFVTAYQYDDKNLTAVGCSALFLNWLGTQLHYDRKRIVSAGGASSTLAAVFTALSGKKDTFQRFKTLLDANFPPGKPSKLTTDNPFPLKERQWTDASACTNGGPPPKADSDPRLSLWGTTPCIVYRSSDGHIHLLSAAFGETWNHSDLMLEGSFPPAIGAPFGEADLDFGQVFYRSKDGHVNVLRYNPVAGLECSDFTTLAGAPPAASEPSVVVAGSDLDLVYRTSDGHVQLITIPGFETGNQGAPVSVAVATTAGPVPLADSDPKMSLWGMIPSIAYRSSDGHVHLLTATLGGTWSHSDLTAGNSFAPAAGNPEGSYDGLCYRDKNGHVNALWLHPIDGMQFFDLNAATGAPAAASDPHICRLKSTIVVTYRGNDSHVHVLTADGFDAAWTHCDASANTYGDLGPLASGEVSELVCSDIFYSGRLRDTIAFRNADGHVCCIYTWAIPK